MPSGSEQRVRHPSTQSNPQNGSGTAVSETSRNTRIPPALSVVRQRTTLLLASLARKANLPKFKSQAAQELANEHKATRVLGVVFACFFICWTPFFFINFLVAFCGETCAPPDMVVVVALWLGYISSTVGFTCTTLSMAHFFR